MHMLSYCLSNDIYASKYWAAIKLRKVGVFYNSCYMLIICKKNALFSPKMNR